LSWLLGDMKKRHSNSEQSENGRVAATKEELALVFSEGAINNEVQIRGSLRSSEDPPELTCVVRKKKLHRKKPIKIMINNNGISFTIGMARKPFSWC